jgi:hypothetical protein
MAPPLFIGGPDHRIEEGLTTNISCNKYSTVNGRGAAARECEKRILPSS